MALFRTHNKYFAAIEAGDIDTVRDYVTANKRKWLEALDQKGNTPLHLAAARGHMEVISFLLEKGASTWQSNTSDELPLHSAVRGGHSEAVKAFIAKGSSDINYSRRNGAASPLQVAISENNAEILEIFLQTGKADLINGRPPALYYAVQSRKPDMVRVLLAAGADPNVPKAENPHDYDYDDYDDYLFSSRKRSKNKKPFRQSPLHLAATYNETVIANALLAAGAKPLNDESPIHIAAANNNLELATALIAHGVSIHGVDGSGQTALHAAASKGNVEMARFLLAQGVKKEATDNAGRTALSYAQQFALREMVEMLQETVAPSVPVPIKPVEKPAPRIAPAPVPSQPEKPRAETATERDSESWTRAGQNSVVHTSTFPALGRKLTEIFNFESRERVTITENLKSGAETMAPHESFDAVSEDALTRAVKEFRRLGGKAADEDVFRNRLPKAKLTPGGLNG